MILDKALLAALEVVAQTEMASDSAESRRDVEAAKNQVEAAKQTVSKTLNSSQRFAPQAWKLVEAEFRALHDRCASVEKRLNSFHKSLARGAAAYQITGAQGAAAAEASLPTVQMAVEQAEEAVEAAAETAIENKAQLKLCVDSVGQ